MKKFYASLMVLATVVMAISSCSKEKDIQKEGQVFGKMKTITVKTDIETRTTLDADHTNLIWSSGDKISIFNDQNNDNLEKAYEAGADLIVSVPAATKEIYAHYPYYGGNEDGPKKASVYITNAQKQTNPGELNGYNYPMVAKGTVTEDDKALISLYPVASALALNLYHSGLSGEETVLSVTVTPSTSNTGFTGSQITDLTGDNVAYTQGASSSPITVTLTNPLYLGNSAPVDKQKFDGQIYVCLAKQSYANVKFEIETNKGKYTITSSDTPFNCVDNDFVPVNINLAKATFKEDLPATDFEWSLVTSADEIVVGAEVVIAAKASAVAMSQDQRDNNRGQVSVAKNGTKLIWEEGTAVQVFEIVAGSASNTVAFKCSDGGQKGKYIYAASSSSNYLRSTATLNDNASWTVAIGSEGAATLKAQGSNTRNLLRYNSGSSCFSCYGSGQGDVVLYIKGEAADPNAKAIISNGTIEVSATGASADYEDAYSLQNIDETTDDLVLTASENIIDPYALDGDVTFSMAPNYAASKVTGNITLTLASDESVSATIPIEQKGSTLSVSATGDVIIPADATQATFTVTSPEFGWAIKANNTDVQFTQSGNASASPATVTVTSDVVASDDVQTIATLTVYRNNNEDDPQAITIVVKKEAASTETVYYTKATSISVGKKYIIVGGTTSKALVPSTGSGRKSSADVTITSDGILSTSTTDSYAVTIVANGTNYYDITFVSDGKTYYLTYASSTNLGTSTTSSDTKTWNVTEGKHGTFRFADVSTASAGTKRGLVFRGGDTNQFGGYSLANIDGSEYYDIDLYEYQGE